MNRRQFLRTASASTIALGLPASVGWNAQTHAPHLLARPGLISMLGESRVLALGTRYREAFPDENDPTVLCQGILRQHRPAVFTPTTLKQQIQSDFQDGRMVQLDGWVLAITEARQCALFSLFNA